MAPVTLPPSFHSSFWTPDYRSGLDVLFKQLDAGIVENEDLADFIHSQAKAHYALSASLLDPPLGSNHQSTSSLQHTLLSLRGASSARGEAHRALAAELEQRVLGSFNPWKNRHEDRIEGAREDVLGKGGKGGVVGSWEKEAQKLISLRQAYLVKSRAADDSDDDAKFAPATAPAQSGAPADSYTTSPAKASPLKRSGTVADRISEKLRAASIATSPTSSKHRALASIDEKTLPPPPPPLFTDVRSGGAPDSPSSPTREDAFVPPSSTGGKVLFAAPPPLPSKAGKTPLAPAPELPAEPVLLSGLSFPAPAFKDLLKRFEAYVLSTPAPGSGIVGTQSSTVVLSTRQRSTVLGKYEKTFSGAEVIDWLRDNVEGLGGEWERCADAAEELYARGHLSRIGVGRGFDPAEDTFYVLKPNPNETGPSLAALASVTSPLAAAQAAQAASLLKSYLPASLAASDEPAHVRLRREAGKADEVYRNGVRAAEEKRLEMEEKIERGLRVWERWERERLAVVKTVLKQYEEALAKLPARLVELQKGTTLSVEAFNPEADIKALIEGSRTGPYRPRPHIYESIESDLPDVNFGIDLRRWAGDIGWKSRISAPTRPKGAVPEVLEALLDAVQDMYADIPHDERRRAWIYEVPLTETHMLRNAVNNAQLSVDDIALVANKFNVPVVAGTIKLWFLELCPPVLGWEGWEDAKAVYPSVGADQERDVTSAVTSVIGRLPAVQLFVLNAIVQHYKELIGATQCDEADDVYITKLSLSVGRCILRPQYETELTIQDRTPSLFLADLVRHYDGVFPALLDKKKKEADRIMPVRKRTALVDQRMSRSKLEHDLAEADEQPHTSAKTQAAALALFNAGFADVSPVVTTDHLAALGLGPAPSSDGVKVVPPTPEANEKTGNGIDRPALATTGHSAPATRSATPVKDDEVLGAGAAGVKRATSSEASRLRGPRSARGPRPAGGRAPSHGGGSISITSSLGKDEDGPGSERPKSPVAAELARFSHSHRGSVSAIAAQFEGAKKQ
ncbi:Rho-GTPase-activating protein 8 [Cryptotrichosporon argae]